MSDTLEAVYRSHAPMLHRRCLQILGDEQEALDALHDLFLKLSDKLTSFRGDANLTTWLYRVATNHCLNRVRDARNAHRLKDKIAKDEPRDPIQRIEHREVLSKLLAELDEDDVQIAFYRHHDGMTQEEIAEVLGVTSRTVRNRLDRLDEKVKAYLVRLQEVAR